MGVGSSKLALHNEFLNLTDLLDPINAVQCVLQEPMAML